MAKSNLPPTAPRLRPGVNLLDLTLDARDGFVLSRVDGETPVELLADLVGMAAAELEPLLARLEELGAIIWRGPVDRPAKAVSTPRASSPAPAPAQEAVVSSAKPTGGLAPADLEGLVAMEERIARGNLWEVLELAGEPTLVEAKRSYFALSKQFHPDRFFGRNVPEELKARIEDVFLGIKRAYEVLSNEKKRAAYRAKQAPPFAKPKSVTAHVDEPSHAKGPAAPEEDEAERERRLEERRRQITEERKQRHRRPAAQPPTKAVASAHQQSQAQQMFAEGLAQLRVNDFSGAAARFQLALAFDPNNAEYKSHYEQTVAQGNAQRAKRLAEQGETEAATGNGSAAAWLFAQASDATPTNATHALRAAREFTGINELEQAWVYAERALAASPKRADVRVVVAEVLEKRGDKSGAIANYEAALALDPKDPGATKALKRLNKGAR